MCAQIASMQGEMQQRAAEEARKAVEAAAADGS
jgi:hypothetical protein